MSTKQVIFDGETSTPMRGGIISMPGIRSSNPMVQAQIDAARKRREAEEREAAARAAARQDAVQSAVQNRAQTSNAGVRNALAGLGAAQTAVTVPSAPDRSAYEAWDAGRKERQAARAEEIKQAGGYYATLPDFAAMSVARRDENDPTYRYINDPEGYGREYDLAAEGRSDLAGIRLLEDSERRTYTYLYNKSGKQIADEYLDSVMKHKSADIAKQSSEYNRRLAEVAPVASSVLSPVASVMGGAVSAVDLAAQGAKKLVTGENIDYNSRAQQIGRTAEDIRETVAENIESPVGQFFYNTGMSALDSLAAGTMGPVIAGIALGAGAGASTARDVAARGGSDGQALLAGVAAGVAEGLFEKLSIGEFKALKDVPVTSVKTLVGNVLKQMGVNASEELFTEVANIISDELIMGEMSNYRTSVNAYRAQGLGEAEAKKKAALDIGLQVATAAASGAVMGGAFGGIGTVQSGIKNLSAGKAIMREGIQQDVLDTGAAQVKGTESRTLADKLTAKQEAGETIGRAEIGALGREVALQEARNRDALGNDLPLFDEASAGVRASAAALRRAGDVMGREVRFFRDAAEVGGYAEDGVVWLNVDAKEPMAQVFAHELTHTAENAGIYAELRQMALGQMDAGELAAAIDQKKKTYRDFAAKTDRLVKELDDAGAEAELVADYAATLFSDEAAIADFAKRNRNAAARVYERIREWSAGVRGDEERAALAKAQRVYARALRETRGDASGERQNRIGRTKNNEPIVIVESDILEGVPESDWPHIVKENLGRKFPNGLEVNGQKIKINSQTKREMTESENTKWLRDNNKALYANKMRATDNANEIVEAARDWVGEEPNHDRTDNIIEFARGTVLMRIGERDYTADVVVGITKNGSAVLYDIVRMKQVKEKNSTRTESNNRNRSLGSSSDRYAVTPQSLRDEKGDRRYVSAFDDSIPQVGADGNTSAQDVTEMSHSGRQWSIAGEESADLQSRIIPELVRERRDEIDSEVVGALAYAITDRDDAYLQSTFGDSLGDYEQSGDVARELVYVSDMHSEIRDVLIGYEYDLDANDNLAIAEQMIEQARRDGLVEQERDGTIALTEKGLDMAFVGQVPETVKKLREQYVRRKIDKVAKPLGTQNVKKRSQTVEDLLAFIDDIPDPARREAARAELLAHEEEIDALATEEKIDGEQTEAQGDDRARESAAVEDLLQYTEEIGEAEEAEIDAENDGWYDEEKDSEEAIRSAQEAIDKIDDILHQNQIQTERDRQHTEEQIAVEMEKEKQTMGERLREAKSYFLRKLVDSGEAVSRIGRAFGDKQLYHYYNMARSASNAGISMICDAQTDVRGKKVGESLNDIFDPIRERGADYYTKFQLYMYHMHNIDRMSRVERAQGDVKAAHEELEKFRRLFPNYALMTTDQVYQIAESWSNPDAALAQEYLQLIRALNRAGNVQNKPVFGFAVTAEDSREEVERLLRENPEFAEYAQKVYQYNDNLMQYRVDSGLVDAAFAAKLKEIYPHYVPTFRMMDKAAAKQSRLNQVRIGKTVGRAEGSAKKLKPLHKAMAEQTLSVVREGSQNRFGLRLLTDVEKNRPPEFNTRDIESMKAAIEASPIVLQNEVLDIEEMESGMTADSFDDTLLDRADLATNTYIIRDGDRRWKMTVSPALYEAVYALNPDIKEANAVTKAVRAINDVYKKLITAWNPFYSVKNFIRDLQDAGLYSGNAVDFAKKYPKAWKEMYTDGELWRQYKALGGTYSSIFDYETGTTKKDPEWKQKTAGRVTAMNMAIEQAPRLAEFMAVRERLMQEKGEAEASMDTLMEAMYAAADITTNFGRSGTWGKMLNQNYIPFFNAGVQGFDKLVRWVSGKKTAQEWARLAANAAIWGIAPAVLNALMYGDDEEWDELNSRDKDVYYLLKVGPATWLKLPKGRAASLFGMVVNMADDAIRGNDVRFDERARTAVSQVAPVNPLQDNILKAWFDADLFDKNSPGKTWYGGDIEPQRLRDLAPEERYDEKTDKLSMLIGRITGLSPKKINYLLDSYSGVIGDIVLPLLTPRAESDPFSSAFIISSQASNRLNTDFYNTMDELTYAKNSLGASGVDTVMYRFWNKQSTAVSDINKAIREIESDADLSRKEKRELVSAQYDVRNAVQREARATMDKYRESAEYWYSKATGDEEDRIDYAYLMANKEVFGSEYAIKTYNKSTYEKAQRMNSEGVSFDHFFYMQFGAKKAAEEADIESNEMRSRIHDLSASDEEKKALYRGFVSTTRDDDIAKMEEAGLGFDSFLEVQNEYTLINESYSGAGDKQNAFSRWLRGQNYSAYQKKVIKDCFTYFYSIPASEKKDNNTGFGFPAIPQIKLPELPEIKLPTIPEIKLPGFGG